jgi:DNA-binding ferritin-like protein
MDKPRMLKRDATPSASYSSAPAGGNCDTMTAACVSELMNAGTSFHKLHLKITGMGSYAAHKALNELYDAMPGHADDLAEGYQGASEKLLTYSEVGARTLDTIEDALVYLRDLTNMVNALQAKMPYSELVNSLDTVKDTINSGKYKLKFLK